jgi:hypothetical protein
MSPDSADWNSGDKSHNGQRKPISEDRELLSRLIREHKEREEDPSLHVRWKLKVTNQDD